jgi:cellulose biosynthesis protein BcsQ
MTEDITIYSFYNNKGGVGKTTLCSNVAALYAKNNPTTQVLVIDMCPQANVSQFMLGGGHKGYQTNQKLQSLATRKNIVGFIDWILKNNAGFSSLNTSYAIQVSPHNEKISENLYLIAGDSFLESLSLALNYAVLNPANLSAWSEYMTAIRRLSEEAFNKKYSKLTVFIDCNPSFSIYTQMALVSSDYLIIPMMADFSSIEGIKSIFMMLYGEYPTAALKKYAHNIITFNKQMDHFKLKAPRICEFVFNNYTANLGVAAAYDSIRNELSKFCYAQYTKFPHHFAPTKETVKSSKEWERYYVSDVKDFHTAGKLSASLGIPIYELPEKTKYHMPDGSSVSADPKRYAEAMNHIIALAGKLQ